MNFNKIRRWALGLGLLAVVILVGIVKNLAIYLGVLR